MFKKILILFTIAVHALYAGSAITTHIEKFNKGYAVVTAPKALPIGVSGIVLRNFDNTHEAIIANAVVVQAAGSHLALKLTPYRDLQQDVLPTYNIAPKVGDRVVLQHHYSRILPIVPDKASFDALVSRYPNLTWVHPDLYASALESSFHSKPNRENLQAECRDDSIGLLLFQINDKDYFVDCKSFHVIDTQPATPATTFLTPFYNRLGKIKGRFMGLFGGGTITDFNHYYSQLLFQK